MYPPASCVMFRFCCFVVGRWLCGSSSLYCRFIPWFFFSAQPHNNCTEMPLYSCPSHFFHYAPLLLQGTDPQRHQAPLSHHHILYALAHLSHTNPHGPGWKENSTGMQEHLGPFPPSSSLLDVKFWWVTSHYINQRSQSLNLNTTWFSRKLFTIKRWLWFSELNTLLMLTVKKKMYQLEYYRRKSHKHILVSKTVAIILMLLFELSCF